MQGSTTLRLLGWNDLSALARKHGLHWRVYLNRYLNSSCTVYEHRWYAALIYSRFYISTISRVSPDVRC